MTSTYSSPEQTTPLLSFVMPAYKGQWLSSAVESILAQTYTNIELIVVNDCSPDDLDATMARYDDPRIRYYHNKENLGGKYLTKQWEHCIQFARGEYLVIAADDDIYAPTFAEECMRLAVEYPSAHLIRTCIRSVDEEGNEVAVERFVPEGSRLISQLEYIYAYREGHVFICMGNFVMRTSVLKEKGFVDFPRALSSDIAMSIMMAECGVACTPKPLFSFRLSTVQLSGSKAHLEPKIEASTQFFEWVTSYPIPQPQNEQEASCLQRLTYEDWREKCVYDYFNMIIRYVSLAELPHYLRLARYATPKEKAMMVLRYFKRRIFS